MTQQRVDLTPEQVTREGYEAFNRGDLDWIVEHLHPEIVWEDAAQMPDARTYQGREGARSFLESFTRYWAEIRFEPEDLVAEGKRVTVEARVIGEGRASRAPVQAKVRHEWEFRDGLAWRARTTMLTD